MIGVYPYKCLWQKKGQVNKRNEGAFNEPVELPCTKSVEKLYVRSGNEEKVVYKSTYNFMTTEVKEGDKIDGYLVTATEEGRGIDGELLTYKAVIDNA